VPLNNLAYYIKSFLEEDRISHDITTALVVPHGIRVEAVINAKEAGVCCGINVAALVFRKINKKLKFTYHKKDGMNLRKGDRLATIEGPAQSILKGERLALNLLSHLSGIATTTNKFVTKTRRFKIKILDTRKTTPGLRLLEKYAVRCGGGYNHRMDLSDGILIKDNHLFIASQKKKSQSLQPLLKNVRTRAKGYEVEIEVKNIAEFKDVISGKPDIIMLDNMNIGQIRKCVKLKNRYSKKIHLEVSGKVSLKNVEQIASSGVERISIGSLTHSSKSIDISLDIIKVIF